MKTRERDPDPRIERELAAIDAALAGRPVDQDLSEIAALATELRGSRPQPPEEFAAELDARAAAGFSSSAAERPRRFAALRGRPLLPLATAAAALMLTVVVGLNLIGGGDPSVIGEPEPSALDAPEGGSASRESAPGANSITTSPGSPGPAAAPEIGVPPPRQGPLKPGKDRVQESSASLTLSTEAGEVAEVADGVIEVVDRYRGIVVSSNVSSSGDGGRASFDLRIPAANLQPALADLSELASVASRDEGTLDITAPFVSAEQRFDEAKAEVDALVAQLAEAASGAEIDSIKARLAIARPELAAARAELASLKQRAGFSRLSVAIISGGDADGWSLGDAADDALGVLEDLAGAGLVALAVIVPLGLLAGLGAVVIARLRRRRREAALDE